MDNISDIKAIKKWEMIPEEVRTAILGNAFCKNCGMASFAMGYTLQYDDGLGIVIEGECAKCGERICRVVEEE
ncbi:hypothetical protein M2149_000937 [Lachnospiraceae bacterium PFB1-21]